MGLVIGGGMTVYLVEYYSGCESFVQDIYLTKRSAQIRVDKENAEDPPGPHSGGPHWQVVEYQLKD